MVNDRFIASPFEGIALTAPDANSLLDIVNTVVHTSLECYENFWTVEKAKVDTDKWKLIKSKGECPRLLGTASTFPVG